MEKHSLGFDFWKKYNCPIRPESRKQKFLIMEEDGFHQWKSMSFLAFGTSSVRESQSEVSMQESFRSLWKVGEIHERMLSKQLIKIF